MGDVYDSKFRRSMSCIQHDPSRFFLFGSISNLGAVVKTTWLPPVNVLQK